MGGVLRLSWILGGLFISFLLTFILQKLYFLTLTWHEGITAADVFDVVRYGIPLDAAVCCYALVLPWLLLFVNAIRRIPHLTALLWAWYMLMALLFSIIIVADASLYPFWQFKLDASVFLYTDKPADALASVSVTYVLARIVWIVVWMWLQWRIAVLLRVFRSVPEGEDDSHNNAQAQLPGITHAVWLRKTLFFVAMILIAGIMALLIRGGVGKGTNNVSVAYYSDNQYLNHAAVNPVFNLLYSLGKQEDFASEAQYFSPEEAQQIAATIYDNNKCSKAQAAAHIDSEVENSSVVEESSSVGVGCSSVVEESSSAGVGCSSAVPTNNILRTQRPDILLIIWEGGCWNILRTLKAGPALTALADESIDFSNCYANSFRTDRGQLSLLSGWPAIPKTSLMKIPEKCDHLPALPRTLLNNGYNTTFWYGGDITFANTGGYMHQAGFQRCVSDKDFSRSERATSWGVYDATLFDKMADDMLSSVKGSNGSNVKGADGSTDRRPSFNCVMTLSSHEPWTVPGRRFADDRLNAFAYTDECIASLLDRLRKSPLWDNLLVIITADHGVRLIDDMPLSDPKVTHIPMLWTGGAVKAPRHVTPLMNQSDLAATLLSQMGISHEAFGFSRDVLSAHYVYPTAFHTYNGGISFVDSTGYTTYDLDGDKATLNPDPQRERKAKGILQYLYRKICDL